MEGEIMRNISNHIGIGCFAEGDTVRRVFRKALESFLLGRYEDLCPSAARVLSDENLTRFFKSVIHFGTGGSDQLEPASNPVPESAKITGFFLGFNRQALHLVLFFLDNGFQRTRLITRLEKFTLLRKKRMH